MTENKMTYEQVQEKVYEIVKNYCSGKENRLRIPTVLTNEMSLTNDLGFDSLDHISMIMKIEKVFQINQIEDRLADEIMTVGDIVKCVYDRQAFCKAKNISVSKNQRNEVSAADLIKKAPDIPSSKTVPMSKQEAMLRQKLQGTDLYELAGKTFELNGYKFTIAKIKQNARVKGK